VVYFHYLQGLLSATISAILTIVAATVAVSYHENLVALISRGKFADQAATISLIAIFAVTYLFLRWVFDKLVPGNIRLPVLVDKIGAGAMGLVAAIFSVGLVALAAQMMPFPASIAGYARYELLGDREVVIPNMQWGQQNVDVSVHSEIKNDNLEQGVTGLWIPADDMLLSTVAYLSDGGSLAGERKLQNVHPDYLQELFGQRLGIQVGAKRSAINGEGDQQVRVEAVYKLEQIQQIDAELPTIRGSRNIVSTVRPEPDQLMLVVRAMFDKDASDADFMFRFSPGSARLVIKGKNYFPVGTLNEGSLLYSHKPDDYLFIDLKPENRGADLVFIVPKEQTLDPTVDPKTKQLKIDAGIFLEVKRYARVELGGMFIEETVIPSPQIAVLRKPQVSQPAVMATASDSPLKFIKLDLSARLPISVNVGTGDLDATNITLPTGGSASLRAKAFSLLSLPGDVSIQRLQLGEHVISELFVPANMKMVQVVATPAAAGPGANPWSWADQLGSFELVDEKQTKFKAYGAWTKIQHEGQDKLAVKYNAVSPVANLPSVAGATPTDVWLGFLVPVGTNLRHFTFKSKEVAGTPQEVR
jgi:hypothetical protein